MLISYLAMIGTEHEKSEFVKLYERYRKLMHYAAKRILGDDSLAEEAVQEAFLRIAKNFGKVSGADQSATKKFVLIITENAAKTLHRRESRHISGREYPEGMEAAAGALQAAGIPRQQRKQRPGTPWDASCRCRSCSRTCCSCTQCTDTATGRSQRCWTYRSPEPGSGWNAPGKI